MIHDYRPLVKTATLESKVDRATVNALLLLANLAELWDAFGSTATTFKNHWPLLFKKRPVSVWVLNLQILFQ